MSDAAPQADATGERWVLLLPGEDQGVGRLLSDQGWNVTTASSLVEALEFVEAVRFDAVLVSLASGPEDAIQTTRGLRRLQRNRAGRASVIGLATEPSEEVRRRCLEAGMDAVLAEPFDPVQLDRVLGDDRRSGERELTAGG